MKNKVLWKPLEESIKSTNFFNFIKFLSKDVNFSIDTTLNPEIQYKQLYNWSISSPKIFWKSLLEFSKIKYDKDILSICDNVNKMPGAKWFEGIELNFAENLMSYRDNRVAIHFYGENKVYRTLTFNDLYRIITFLIILKTNFP